MHRLNFILVLIILAVSLHIFATTARNMLMMADGIVPKKRTNFTAIEQQQSLFTQFFSHSRSRFSALTSTTNNKSSEKSFDKKGFFSRPKVSLSPDQQKPATESTLKQPFQPQSSGPVLLEIIDEEPPPPLNNPFLGEEISAQLTKQLARQRDDNAQLAQDVQALFGNKAQQEVIAALTQNEHASYQNASTCRNVEQYTRRQEKIDQKTQTQLNRIFETHKDSFNYKSKSGSKAWNAFYLRVNNFRRARD